MKKFNFFNKISTKIAMSFSLTFVLTLLVLNLIIYISITTHINTLEQSLVVARKEVILEEVNNIISDCTILGEQEISNIIEKVSSHRDQIYVNFKFPEKTYQNFDKITLPYTIDIDQVGEYHFMKLEKNRFFYLNTMIKAPSGEHIYIQLISDLKASDSLIDALISTMILIDLIGFIFSIVTGVIFAKKTLKPINSISDTAELINLHNLNKRIEISNHDDEIGRLIKVINNMMERLERSFENQTKFISDASHELRTPLSIINGYVDLLNQWGIDNKDLTEEALSSIKGEVFNMTDLMEKLLFIAREENIRCNLNLTDVNISDLLKRVYKEFKMIDKKHTYSIHNIPEFYGFIDEKLILQAVRAIIENSIKYTPKNRKITISYEQEKSYFKIKVSDEGIGIPKKHIPKLFNRFYRVDEARTKDTGGNGLGLSIVKSIVDMHNGHIFIDSDVNKGTTVTLKLPI
ncbi:MAG: HAMP domain-containing sensor histidine kinase [Psychrilyobacter sp.]|uniref:sensor histidine kinase n=1 Tax=Psychrilyobacter sp. TaxID=2586924 RepID=UPI003C72B1CA